MTESIFISVSTIGVAFWLDYLRTGRIQFLAAISLCVGLLIAIRPAGIAFLPMIPISIWLQWHRRDVPRTAVAAVVIVSLALGPVIEQVIYRAVHGDQQASLIPGTLLGKAAMVVRQDATFTGSHASNLRELGSALYTIYRPVREYLSRVPSLPALPIMTSAYEVMAQYQILNEEIALMSARAGVPGDVLRNELGIQAIRDNIPGYIRLSLIHYIGQWSIMALKFPPTARSINDYVTGYPRVPLADKLDDLYLHPQASHIAVVVYPALLFAGVLTLAVGLLLPIFVVRRFVGDGPLRYVMIAAFFAATAHVYTLLISFMNVSTPRYLIAVLSANPLGGAIPLPCLQRSGARRAAAIAHRRAIRSECRTRPGPFADVNHGTQVDDTLVRPRRPERAARAIRHILRDIRMRVIARVESGASRREAADQFDISPSAAVKWVKCFHETGSCAAKPRGGSTSPLEEHAQLVLALIEEQPDLTLDEVVSAMHKHGLQAVAPPCGGSSSATTSPSKKSLRAAEQDRADVARARRRWMRQQAHA